MLRLENLEKRYQTGDLALKDIHIEIPRGQVMALIGPSGAGKSTLIRCVNRLVEPTAGKVYLGDLELTRLGSSELRRARRRLEKIAHRLEVLGGYLIAYLNIDEVIHIIRFEDHPKEKPIEQGLSGNPRSAWLHSSG